MHFLCVAKFITSLSLCRSHFRRRSPLMVTLRHLRSQQEAEARRARLEETRRLANQMGVERARIYASRKRKQELCVMNDLHLQWVSEQKKEAAVVESFLCEVQAQKGEGMRAAAELEAQQRGEAAKELHAWEAERALEGERHKLALAKVKITRAIEQEPRRSIVERKKAVRFAEENRSKTLVAQRHKHTIPSFGGKTAVGERGPAIIFSQEWPTHRRMEEWRMNAGPGCVEVLGPLSPREDAAVVAARYAEERQRENELAREALCQKRREATARAAALKRQQEEELQQAEEETKRRADNLAAITQHATNELKKEDGCARLCEERRSLIAGMKQKTEFEALFLKGKLKSCGKPQDCGAVTELCSLFEMGSHLDTVSSLMPAEDETVVRLPVMALKVLPVEVNAENFDVVGEVTDGTWDAGNTPSRDGRITTNTPQCIPEEITEQTPLLFLRASEEVSPVPVAAAAPGATYIACHSDESCTGADSSGCSNDTQALSECHQQLFSNLRSLQEKLQSAMGPVRAPDATQRMNVTLSSVSSTDTSSRVPGEGYDNVSEGSDSVCTEGMSEMNVDTDSDGRSSSFSATDMAARPTMTVEQLKAALLQMRLRLHTKR
uniref:Uncharacterized protein n=1 Tax=Trypanosoma congolense (strain IL3000) TaxID=1068625 RepID=G0UM72_TRYCI|nr:conserved hypothetical protein [Trypanosoma congolense IL3000]